MQTHPLEPDRGTLIGRALLERRIIHIPDVLADPEYTSAKAQQLGGFRAVLGIPMLREDTTLGVFMIARRVPRAFTDKQIQLVATFADQAIIAIENVRLFDEVQVRTAELQESLEYQTATTDVLNVISRSPNHLQPVLDAIVETAGRLCEAYDANLWLRAGDGLRNAAHRGPIPIIDEWPITRDWTAGRAFIDRRTVHVHNLAEAGEDFPERQEMALRLGHRTIVSTPLMRKDEAIGVLALRRKEVRPFSDKQVAVLQTFADQAVIAIENARLFEEVQERTAELSVALEQQTATSEVLKVISRSAFALQPVLDTLVETAGQLCEADRATVFRYDGTSYRSAAHHGYSQEFTEFLEQHPIAAGRGTAIGRTALEGRTVHIPDVLADPEYTFFEAQSLGGWRATLAVPLLREGKPIGAFSLNRSEPRPFTDKQIELVTTFADQAVIAIENVRLFEEVQARTRELAQSLEYQTATSDVLNVIRRSPSDIQPVLDAIVDTAARLCRGDFAIIWKLHQRRYHLASVASDTTPELAAYARANPIDPGRGTLVGRVALERATVHIPDVTLDSEYRWSDGRWAGLLRTMLGVPLLRDGTVIGVIAVHRRMSQPFSQREIDLVTTFADQAVIAINNVGLFEEVQARTSELTESLEYQTAISDVLEVIGRSPSELQPVFHSIARSAAHLCAAQFCHVFRFDGNLLHFEAHHGLSPEGLDALRKVYPLAPGRDSAAGRSIVNAAVEQIADVRSDPDYAHGALARTMNFQSIVAVPMLRDGAPIGSIAVARPQTGPFPLGNSSCCRPSLIRR